ncbi:MAG: c-type cytochrome biogenesis protein CcmI [Pseudomonadota bacterium]
MIVWLFGGILIIAVAFFLARPILKSRDGDIARAEYDLAIFRDQLSELERDQNAGLIRPTEAHAARTEIQRRMLAADARRTAEGKADSAAGAKSSGAKSSRVTRLAVVGLIFGALPGGALLLYGMLGSPETPDFPLAARSQTQPQQQASQSEMTEEEAATIDEMVQRLADRLELNPDDAEGWVLLARTYGTLRRYTEQADALARASALIGDDAELKSARGEALTRAADGTVTEEALATFNAALKIDGEDPRARYYLGVSEAQAGRYQAALSRWIALDRESEPDAPFRPALRARIIEAAEQSGLDVDEVLAGAGPPLPDPQVAAAQPTAPLAGENGGGPSAEDMAAVANMSQGERDEMVRGMVGGLAERLAEDPSDRDGWDRLIRSYMVLGEQSNALNALKSYASAFPDDADLQIQFARAAVTITGANGVLPDGVMEAMDRVLAENPDAGEALWYRGLGAARNGEVAAARRDWERLRGLLPPDDENLAGLQEALESLPSAQ